MDIQDKDQKVWRNEDRLNKQKKLYSWLGDKEDRRWQTTIPDDMLSIISDLLPLSDFIKFRGVCCNWRRVPSGRSNITEFSRKDPWCILYDFDAHDKDTCLFYQCNNLRSCSVKLPGLRGAKCFLSKLGWLFIRRNNDYLFFNPLTLEEIFLPKYLDKSVGSSACQVGTFSGSPTSQHCVVVLLSSRDSSTVQIASCRINDNEWMMATINVDIVGVPCDSVLLPSPRHVYFDAVNDVSQRFNHINNLFVFYDNDFLMFDFLKKKFKFRSFQLLVEGAKECYRKLYKSFNWYSILKEVHYDDWICKFGEEFTFSFCLFDDCKRVDESKHVFDSHSCTIHNVPVIKAAWL